VQVDKQREQAQLRYIWHMWSGEGKFNPYRSPAWTKQQQDWEGVMAMFLPAMCLPGEDRPEVWWDAWSLCQAFKHRAYNDARKVRGV
jgi:hypothetical protein